MKKNKKKKDNKKMKRENKGNDRFHFDIAPSMIDQNCSHVKYMRTTSIARLSNH